MKYKPQQTRSKFQFTQLQMAQCLGVSRSTIEHNEQGRKSLPTAALLRLAKLDELVREAEGKEILSEKEAGRMSKPFSKLRESKDTKLQFHLLKTERMERQLLGMQEKYIILKRQLMVAKYIVSITDPGNQAEMLPAQLLLANTKGELARVNEEKQIPLRAKIMGRRAEYEVLVAAEYDLNEAKDGIVDER